MVRWPAPYSFRAQIVVVTLTSLAVITLAGLLIRDVVSRTQSRLLAEARRQCESACRELVRQHAERMAWGADMLETLPFEAQDLSLRALTATVLLPYGGIEGGFYRAADGRILGYAGGLGRTAKLAPRELELVSAAAGEARSAPFALSRAWGNDWVLVVAAPLEGGGGAAWALKRLKATQEVAGRGQPWLYGALALSATLGVAAIISLWLLLRGGLARINAGLSRLEEDFRYRLPPAPGEFGQIVRAINQMAERRLALEAEVRRQDRLAILGKLVAGVAHEIRNPLNSLRLTLELLGRRLARGVATGEEIQGAVREIDRLDGILTRLLAFGRPAPVERRPQDLVPLMEEAIRMIQQQAQRKGVRVRLETDACPLRAEVDGPQFVQVLLNLLLNAIEASPENAAVEVTARCENASVCIFVTDHGPGIPEAIRPHIFDAFFTTRPEGTGLGLAISREIVAGHGGALEYDPSGPGTTFRIRLPYAGGRA